MCQVTAGITCRTKQILDSVSSAWFSKWGTSCGFSLFTDVQICELAETRKVSLQSIKYGNHIAFFNLNGHGRENGIVFEKAHVLVLNYENC